MTQDDQTRPDLDAALDAVIPSLTAVDDDAAATSLRRTRIALAEQTASSSARGWGWTWPAAAAVAGAIVAAVVFWPRAGEIETPRVAVKPTAPAPVVLPSEPVRVAPSVPAAPQVEPTRIGPPRVARTPQVAATTAPRPDVPPRPDPLVALVRAVQRIPESAWTRTVTEADAPLAVSDVPIASIDVSPLDTPALPGTVNEPVAPGEP